jgi:hypothetical protein
VVSVPLLLAITILPLALKTPLKTVGEKLTAQAESAE